MESGQPEAPTADAFSALVRAHVDQVHDRVRRAGCGAAGAVRVVEASALDLLAPAHEGVGGTALTGRWFATATALGRAAGGGDRPAGAPHVPGESDRSALAAAGLARRDEAACTALLTADVYRLPLPVTAAALGAPPPQALRLLGRARVALLPELFEGEPPDTTGCDEQLLARLAADPAPDAPALRHVRGCRDCAEVLQAQQDVRGLLGELVLLPVPEHDRELLLERIAVRARAVLPTGGRPGGAGTAAPGGLLRPVPALLALLLAALVGVALGMLLSQPAPVQAAPQRQLPKVVAPQPVAPDPVPSRAAAPAVPVTTVFTYPALPTTPPPARPVPASPTPPGTPPPTTGVPTSPPPALPARVAVVPAAGRAGRTLQVDGTGWVAGAPVSLVLLDPSGAATSATATATATAAGVLTAALTGWPADAPAGTYRVVATQGATTAHATYRVVRT